MKYQRYQYFIFLLKMGQFEEVIGKLKQKLKISLFQHELKAQGQVCNFIPLRSLREEEAVL